MRRASTILLTLGLAAGMLAVPAEAGKKKTKKPAVRVFEAAYTQPAIGVGGAGGGCQAGACPTIPIAANETYAMIVVEDDTTPSGYVELSYDSDGDGLQNLGNGPIVCGSTPEPVPVEPGVSYTAWPWAAGIGCPGSSSTSGTIKVMLSNDPAALAAALEG